MQLQQRYSATDFVQLAQSRLPIQPLADQPRENPSCTAGFSSMVC